MTKEQREDLRNVKRRRKEHFEERVDNNFKSYYFKLLKLVLLLNGNWCVYYFTLEVHYFGTFMIYG